MQLTTSSLYEGHVAGAHEEKYRSYGWQSPQPSHEPNFTGNYRNAHTCIGVQFLVYLSLVLLIKYSYLAFSLSFWHHSLIAIHVLKNA